jgi:RHS repeat-associated protein
MEEIELHYFVARWIDPLTGHFVQADTIVPSAGNAMDFNRYAYVRYNPFKYIDPSGHDPKCGTDGIYCTQNSFWMDPSSLPIRKIQYRQPAISPPGNKNGNGF